MGRLSSPSLWTGPVFLRLIASVFLASRLGARANHVCKQIEQVFEAAEADLEAAARAAAEASAEAAVFKAEVSALRREIAALQLEGVRPEHCQSGVPIAGAYS